MELIGLDVGFSAERPSSGVARLTGAGDLRLGHTTSRWEDRKRVTGTVPVHVAAIDAPYTKASAENRRACERVFAFGKFQRRCKPGSSHVPGTGRRLREAGWETAQQLRSLAPDRGLGTAFPRVDDCNIVEAFPNAFLGACLDERVYEAMPGLRRGKKFDWLYDCWVSEGLFQKLLAHLDLEPITNLVSSCEQNQQHDQRAALVCLMTAACVYAGRSTAIGDPWGGYFFMPPWELWARWAQVELDRQRGRLPTLRVWIDGRSHDGDDALPGLSR